MRKFISFLLSFIFVFVFIATQIVANFIGTYLNTNFYNEKLSNSIYDLSEEIIVNTFISENKITNDYKYKSDFKTILKDNFTSSDIDFLINDFLSQIQNYNKGDEISIKLKAIKSHIQNAVNEYVSLIFGINKNLININSDFYEYIPSEIIFNQDQLSNVILNIFKIAFNFNLEIQIALYIFLSIFFLLIFFVIAKENYKKFIYSGTILLIAASINFFITIIGFKLLHILFLNSADNRLLFFYL
jgi:hypothetical protein